jgi:protease-4
METPEQNAPNQGNPPPPPPQYPPQYAQYPQYPREPRRRSRWWVPVVIVVVIIVGFIAVIAGIIAGVGSAFKSKPVAVKEKTVLQLKVSGTLEERTTLDFFNAITDDANTSVTYLDVLTAIKRAKEDKNIAGIFYRAGDLKAGFSKVTEIRAALVDFKTSGKFIYAFLETGDERDYYIASVADSIFVATESLVELNGFATKGVFLKGTLDKIGVEFYIQQFEDYKSAGEQLSRKQYSEPAKEELRALLDQRMSVFVQAVASGRKMDEVSVRAALERGVYTADSLLALHFVDGVASEGNVKERIKARLYGSAIAKKSDDKKSDDKKSDEKSSEAASSDKKLNLVALNRYVGSDSFKEAGGSDDKVDKDTQIALIAATGTITSSGDTDDNIVASYYIKQLQKARENKKVKAIILRIDSPGGSVIASDALWEEILRTRKEKPVFASMSDVAASGGYYMAMPCDTIIAHPTTITGSIGVILTIPIATKLVENMGVSLDTVQTAPDALPYDPALPFTERNRKKLYEQSEKIYRRFVSRVAESRKKSFEDTRAVAKGRVWTGIQAKERGLVDTLGGLQTALAIAKRRVGIAPNAKVVLKRYPETKEPFEIFFSKFLDDDKDDTESAGMADSFIGRIRAAVERRSDTHSTEAMMKRVPLWTMLSEDMRSQLLYLLKLGTAASTERVLVAMPSVPEIR